MAAHNSLPTVPLFLRVAYRVAFTCKHGNNDTHVHKCEEYCPREQKKKVTFCVKFLSGVDSLIFMDNV